MSKVKMATINNKIDKLDGKVDKLLFLNSACQYTDEILSLTLNDWLDKWYSLYKVGKLKPSTLYKIERNRSNYITHSIGNNLLSSITGLQLMQFLVAVPYERQRQHLYTLLHDCFGKAYALQLIPFNPMLSVERPSHKKTESKCLSDKQLRRFLISIENDNLRDLFAIFLFAGLRKGEGLALTYDDIDLTNRYINVSKSLNLHGDISSPKTDLSIRLVPLFDNLYPYLKKYENICGSQRIFPFSAYYCDMHLKKCMQAAGITDKGYGAHSLRHTCCTAWYEAGIPDTVRASWLGHSSTYMTVGTYTHKRKDYEQKVIAQYNNLLK